MGSRKKAGPPAVPAKAPPGPKNQAAIKAAAAAFARRPARVSIAWEPKEDGRFAAGAPHTDADGHALQIVAALGSTSSSFMASNLSALELATRDRREACAQSVQNVNAALAIVEAVGPQDELEGALAVQMASCHSLTMEMLGRAKSTDRTDHLELYSNMAVKLQRTFTAQIEALARMRGKGQQTVRVEHVTVQPGAQAIVGDVHHHAPGGAGGRTKTEEQPYEPDRSAAGAQECEALPSPDPQRNGVPITGHAERPLSPARRPVARRTTRQPERAQARVLEPRDDRDAAGAAADAA